MNHNRHIYNQRVIVCVNKITDNFTLAQKSQFYDVRSEKKRQTNFVFYATARTSDDFRGPHNHQNTNNNIVESHSTLYPH